MLIRRLAQILVKLLGYLPLPFVLAIPFVLTFSTATFLLGYFSFRQGQASVNTLLTPGKIFILERSGYLISEHAASNSEDSIAHIKALNHPDALIRESARYLLNNLDEFTSLKQTQQRSLFIHGQRYYLQITPLHSSDGLGPLLVAIVSESEFAAQTNVNMRTILFWWCITSLVGAGAGLFASRWVTNPLLQLNQVARKITAEPFDPLEQFKSTNLSPLTERTDEIGELAVSFQLMLEKLQASFTEMQKLNAALSRNESQLTQFLEALPVGVAIHHPDGSVHYFNPTARRLLGINQVPQSTTEQFSTTYQLYITDTNQLYPIDRLPALRALQGENLVIDDIEIHVNGKTIPAEVWASPILDTQGQVVYAIVAFQDISERQQAQKLLKDYNQTLEAQFAERTEALRKSEATKQKILEAIPDLILWMDLDGNQLEVISGKNLKEFSLVDSSVNKNISDILPADLVKARMTAIQKATATGEVQIYEQEVIVNSNIQYEEVRVVAVGSDRILVIIRNITDRKQVELALKQVNQELERLATLDGLTKAANRHRFDDYLLQEWHHLMREQQPMSLILCDVDYFKRYNDHYGHQAGDECLIRIANAMGHMIKRSNDLVARYGGEEFVAVLLGTEMAGAIKVAESIRQAIYDLQIPHAQSEVSAYVTISIGIACVIPQATITPEMLIAAADRALYSAKQQGRDRVVVAETID